MEIPARNASLLSTKQREMKNTFESAKSIEETLAAFKDMETCFDEKDLGFACKTVGLKLHQQGKDPNHALSFGIRALRIMFGNYGCSVDHGNRLVLGIIGTLEFLGTVCLELNRFDDSLRYLNTVDDLMNKAKTSRGGDIVLLPIICRVQRNLFRVKWAMRERAEGILHLRKILEIMEKINGKDSEEVAKVSREIAEAYVFVPDFGEALHFCLNALEMHTNNVGDQSLEVAECRKELAFIYFTLGELEKALEQNQLSERILKSFGGNSSLLLEVEIQAANILSWLRRYEKVVETLSAALARTEEDGQDRIIVLTLMAKALNWQKKFLEVKKCAESLHEIVDKKKMGFEDTDGIGAPHTVAMGLKEVATMCEEMHELETALSLLKGAHFIVAELPLSSAVPFLQDVSARVGWLLLSAGKVEEAIPYLEHAVETLKQSFSPVNAEVAYTYLNLYRESFTIGSYSLAINSLKKEIEHMEKSKETASAKEQLKETASKMDQFKEMVMKLEQIKMIAMKLSYDDEAVSQYL